MNTVVPQITYWIVVFTIIAYFGFKLHKEHMHRVRLAALANRFRMIVTIEHVKLSTQAFDVMMTNERGMRVLLKRFNYPVPNPDGHGAHPSYVALSCAVTHAQQVVRCTCANIETLCTTIMHAAADGGCSHKERITLIDAAREYCTDYLEEELAQIANV